MATRNTTHVLKNSDIVNRPLPGSLFKGEPIINTADGILYFSGVTTSTSEWTAAGTGTTANFFEVGSNLYDLKLRNQITKYQGTSGSGLIGKFLSGTSTGFVLNDITAISGLNTYVTGFTYGNNVFTIQQNNGQSELTALINTMTGLTVNGTLSATTVNGNTVNINNLTVTGSATYNQTASSPNDIVNYSTLTAYTQTTDVYVTGSTYSGSVDSSNSTTHTLSYHATPSGGPYTLTGADTYTTGGTYDNNTTTITFKRNDGTSGYTVDLSTIDVNDTYVSGGTVTSGGTLDLFRTDNVTVSVPGVTYWTSGTTGTTSIKAINTTGLDSTGDRSVAWGNQTLASGNDSTAWGVQTSATTIGSTSQGYLTLASGDYSHAEGTSTIASGPNSHSEGNVTITLGDSSHAEGDNTQAIEDYSHAEGSYTVTYGTFSHAEGNSTKTGGNNGYLAISVASGLVTLDASYGDVSTDYPAGDYLYLNDISYDDSYTTSVFIIDSTSFNGTETEILLVDTSVSTSTAVVGNINLNPANWTGDQVYGAPYSHAEGSQTNAISSTSHAEGASAIAAGNYSHAEGNAAIAIGDTSHAEGTNTIASGNGSHAEGIGAISSGDYSHAEGSDTIASGSYSHAEGDLTVAGWRAFTVTSVVAGLITISDNVDYSSVFNSGEVILDNIRYTNNAVVFTSPNFTIQLDDTTVNSGTYVSDFTNLNSPLATNILGTGAHATGTGTKALGDFSETGGDTTLASGYGSHAEGSSTQATGDASHSEGYNTKSIGDYSHAEGYSTIASASYSHSEGNQTTADARYSHTEGFVTQTTAENSHAEGNSTIASGINSHAEGYGGETIGNSSHSEGYITTSIGDYSHSEGDHTISFGDSSHAEGYYTKTGGDNGYLAISVAAGLVTLDGSYGDVSTDYPAGNYLYLNDISYDDSYESISRLIAASYFNGTETEITLSDNTISTTTAIVGNINLNPFNWTGDQVYSAPSSHSEGYYVAALGIGSHAEGSSTVAATNFSHAEGHVNYAHGYASHAEGGNTQSSGDYSHAEGVLTKSIGVGSHSEGSGTTASGSYSHSEGVGTIASGDTSFIHSTNSVVGGDRSVVLGGQNITGLTNDTVYVPYLNLNYVPTLNNTNTEILSRNSVGGQVEYTPLSAFTALDTYVTGFTYSPSTSTFTIKQNQGQSDLTALIDTMTGLTVTGDAVIEGSLTVFGPSVSAFTSNLYVEDSNITLNYNPTGSTTVTSIGAGWTIQDGSGISNTATTLNVGVSYLNGNLSPNTEYTSTTGNANRNLYTQLGDIIIRNTNYDSNAPDGVRVLAEGDVLDGGLY